MTRRNVNGTDILPWHRKKMLVIQWGLGSWASGVSWYQFNHWMFYAIAGEVMCMLRPVSHPKPVLISNLGNLRFLSEKDLRNWSSVPLFNLLSQVSDPSQLVLHHSTHGLPPLQTQNGINIEIVGHNLTLKNFEISCKLKIIKIYKKGVVLDTMWWNFSGISLTLISPTTATYFSIYQFSNSLN